ncbi:MAG: V-type ATP synthase subunit D [Tissierellia bacterium]|nr:V-type ATP synthase subunit D [Tissierellia bacterium]MDD4779891.1 V-type ATP synthase subunit D [Tissierellia bacterium]
MARLNVNPTRMVLTSLKKRLKVAVKGHKMLKDKRDELMKRFLELARENKKVRAQVDDQLANVYSNFVIASAVMSSEVLDEALMYPKQGVSIEVGKKNVMSVNVPVFDFTTTTDDASNIYPYGFANTSGELDSAIKNLSEIFPSLLKLAALEKEVQLLAAEIEKTRRRVNALEYVMIPQFQETIKYIQMKLDENERGNQTRLMKVKDMMVQEAILEKVENNKIAIEEYKREHLN